MFTRTVVMVKFNKIDEARKFWTARKRLVSKRVILFFFHLYERTRPSPVYCNTFYKYHVFATKSKQVGERRRMNDDKNVVCENVR